MKLSISDKEQMVVILLYYVNKYESIVKRFF